MRKYIAHLTVLVLTFSFIAGMSQGDAQATAYSVVVNGVRLTDAQPELRDGQMMVALRPLTEAMGGTIGWDEWAQRAIVRVDGAELALWIGSNLVFRDGNQMWAPVKPYIKDGRTMVPAWWLAARLNAEPQFDGSTFTVTKAGGERVPAGPTVPGGELRVSSYFFPFATGSYTPYSDTMGDPRSFEGRKFPHEGIDILADKGTPIYAVAGGKVVRYGWNTLGGYRVTIQLNDYPEYQFYYAHMDSYAPGLYVGASVKAGQLLGYTGNTGEGPERTEGKFVTHLHFGIYGPNGAINAFPMLKFWERHKVY